MAQSLGEAKRTGLRKCQHKHNYAAAKLHVIKR